MGREQPQMRGDAILGGPCEPHPRAHSPGVTSHLQAPHPPWLNRARLSLSPEITRVRGTVRHPRAPVPRPGRSPQWRAATRLAASTSRPGPASQAFSDTSASAPRASEAAVLHPLLTHRQPPLNPPSPLLLHANSPRTSALPPAARRPGRRQQSPWDPREAQGGGWKSWNFSGKSLSAQETLSSKRQRKRAAQSRLGERSGAVHSEGAPPRRAGHPDCVHAHPTLAIKSICMYTYHAGNRPAEGHCSLL